MCVCVALEHRKLFKTHVYFPPTINKCNSCVSLCKCVSVSLNVCVRVQLNAASTSLCTFYVRLNTAH